MATITLADLLGDTQDADSDCDVYVEVDGNQIVITLDENDL